MKRTCPSHNTRPIPVSVLPSFPPADALALKLRENAQASERLQIKRKAFAAIAGMVSRRVERELRQRVERVAQDTDHTVDGVAQGFAKIAELQASGENTTIAGEDNTTAIQAIEAQVHALSVTLGKQQGLVDVISTERNSSRDRDSSMRKCCDNLTRLLDGGGGGSGGGGVSGGVRSWDAMLRQQDALVSDKQPLFGLRRTTEVVAAATKRIDALQQLVDRVVIDVAEASRASRHRNASAGEGAEANSAHEGGLSQGRAEGRGDGSGSGRIPNGSNSSGSVPRAPSSPKRPQHRRPLSTRSQHRQSGKTGNDVNGVVVLVVTSSTIGAATAADAAAKTGTGTNGAVAMSVDELQAEEGRGGGQSGNGTKSWSSPFTRQKTEQRGHKETLRQRQDVETKRNTAAGRLEVCYTS